VAAVARRAGSHVCRWLSGRDLAVVATGTSACDRTMIDVRRFPGRGGVAVAADTGAGDMGGRFARRGLAVVASAARAGRRTMIECDRSPRGRGSMAGIAGTSGGDVRR